MSSALYLRRARLTIGDVSIPFEANTGLRFSFRVHKSATTKEPNHAVVHVSNLSQATRDRISNALDPQLVGPQKPGLTTLTIEAGYRGLSGNPGTMGVIFTGQSTQVTHTRAGADWETRIIAGSGLQACDVRTQRTFPTGFQLDKIMTGLVTELKSQFSEIDVTQVLKRAKEGDFKGAVAGLFTRPITFDGFIVKNLAKQLEDLGFELSEQDGALQLVGVNETLDTPATSIRLSAETGLVGTVDPVKDAKLPNAHMIKSRSLLRHELKIGSGITLDSVVQRGFYKVRRVEHHGDTHGPTWYTDFVAVEASGGVAT